MRQRAAPVFDVGATKLPEGGTEKESYTCSAVPASLHLRMGRTIAIVLSKTRKN